MSHARSCGMQPVRARTTVESAREDGVHRDAACACPDYRLHEPEKWRRVRAPAALSAAPDCVGIVDLPILAPAGPRGAYS